MQFEPHPSQFPSLREISPLVNAPAPLAMRPGRLANPKEESEFAALCLRKSQGHPGHTAHFYGFLLKCWQ
jgi:hypothetical protein